METGPAGAARAGEPGIEVRLVQPGELGHLIRAGEFALRVTGKSYLDVALSGGGIAVTTRATNAATDGALFDAAVVRAQLYCRLWLRDTPR